MTRNLANFAKCTYNKKLLSYWSTVLAISACFLSLLSPKYKKHWWMSRGYQVNLMGHKKVMDTNCIFSILNLPVFVLVILRVPWSLTSLMSWYDLSLDTMILGSHRWSRKPMSMSSPLFNSESSEPCLWKKQFMLWPCHTMPSNHAIKLSCYCHGKRKIFFQHPNNAL